MALRKECSATVSSDYSQPLGAEAKAQIIHSMGNEFSTAARVRQREPGSSPRSNLFRVSQVTFEHRLPRGVVLVSLPGGNEHVVQRWAQPGL